MPFIFFCYKKEKRGCLTNMATTGFRVLRYLPTRRKLMNYSYTSIIIAIPVSLIPVKCALLRHARVSNKPHIPQRKTFIRVVLVYRRKFVFEIVNSRLKTSVGNTEREKKTNPSIQYIMIYVT